MHLTFFSSIYSFISWTLGDVPVPSPAPLQPRGRGFRTDRSAPVPVVALRQETPETMLDRKSTRLNSSH